MPCRKYQSLADTLTKTKGLSPIGFGRHWTPRDLFLCLDSTWTPKTSPGIYNSGAYIGGLKKADFSSEPPTTVYVGQEREILVPFAAALRFVVVPSPQSQATSRFLTGASTLHKSPTLNSHNALPLQRDKSGRQIFPVDCSPNVASMMRIPEFAAPETNGRVRAIPATARVNLCVISKSSLVGLMFNRLWRPMRKGILGRTGTFQQVPTTDQVPSA